MTILRNALLATAALTLTASPALADHHGDKPVAATEQQSSEHDRLFALFAEADARNLALNPLSRLFRGDDSNRSEAPTSELQSLMRISYAVFCLKKKKNKH